VPYDVTTGRLMTWVGFSAWPGRGEVLEAYVVLLPGQNVEPAELQQWVREGYGAHAFPGLSTSYRSCRRRKAARCNATHSASGGAPN
jgi:hypothetical protein